MHWQDSVVHFGGFYADGNQGSRRVANVVPTETTDGRGLAFFQTNCGTTTAGAVTVAATAACGGLLNNGFGGDVSRTRKGLEFALAYRSAKVQGEYINLNFNGGGFSRELRDWYTSVVWNVTGESFSEMYKDGVFGRLRPKNDFKEGAGLGALELGMRYDNFDGSDFRTTNAAGTGVLLNTPTSTTDGLLVATNRADSWTLGANWILNPNFRFVANFIRTNYDTAVLVRVNGVNKSFDHENALNARAQFDF